MKHTVRKSVVRLIGYIWMPAALAAQEKQLSVYDIENIRGRVSDGNSITREDVADWLTCNSGDFQNVTDFWASIEDGDETVEFDWEVADSEFTYSDCMYQERE